MNKKYVKLFGAMFFSFFLSLNCANARHFSSAKELGEFVDKWREEHPSDAVQEDSWIYIAGKYVYTASNKFSMYSYSKGYQSIDPKKSDTYLFELDKEDGGWNANTLTNLLQNTVTIPTEFDIEYIDTDYPIDTRVNTNNYTETAVGKLTGIVGGEEETQKTLYVARVDDDKNVVIDIKTGTRNEVQGTGIIAALEDLLSEPYVTSITLAVDGETVATLDSENSELNAAEEFDKVLNALIGNEPDTELSALVGKSFTLKYNLADGVLNEGKNEVTVSFTSTYDVEALIKADDDLKDAYTDGSLKLNVTSHTALTNLLTGLDEHLVKSIAIVTTDAEGNSTSYALEDFAELSALELTGKTFVVTLTPSNKGVVLTKGVLNVSYITMIDTNIFFEEKINSGSGNYELKCKANDNNSLCIPVLNITGNDNVNGLDALAKTIENALNTGVIKSVNLQLGRNIEISTYTATDIGTIKGKINGLLKSVAKTYGQIADEGFGDIVLTFNLDTEKGAVSKYGESHTSETYKFKVGSFIDFDAPIEALVTATKDNKYVNITMNHDVVTMDVKLNHNKVLLGNIVNLLHETFDKYDDKMTIKLGDVTYTNVTDASGNKSLRQAFWHLLPVTMYDLVTPGIMANANDLVVTISSDTKTAYPGTLGILSNGEKTATYTFKFIVSGFDVDEAATDYAAIENDYFKMNYAKTTSEEEGVTSRDLTVQLSNLTTKFSEFVGKGGTGLLAGLQKYAGTFTVTVNGKPIDLTSTAAMATDLPEALGIALDNTINDLAEKTVPIVITLNDHVNTTVGEGETREATYTINVTFKTDNAIVNFDGKSESLSSLIENGVEKIILTEDVSISEELALNKDFEIDGQGHEITTDVKISDNVDLKLSNVKLVGKVTVDGDANSEVTITGDENTTIKGSINASDDTKVKSLKITSVKVEGTSKDLVSNDKKAVIDATGAEEFVMTGSSVKYTGDNSTGTGDEIYSLIKVDGNTTIKNSKFDITKIKNPIEFKYYGTASTGINKIDILDNEFTGDNYVAGDSHNVISVYALNENAVVNVMRNKFACANSALRISNNGDKPVTFNVVGNTVESYNKEDKLVKALIVIRPNIKINLSNITINHNGNKFGTADYTYKAGDETKEESIDTRLVYIYDKDTKVPIGTLKVSDYIAQP